MYDRNYGVKIGQSIGVFGWLFDGNAIVFNTRNINVNSNVLNYPKLWWIL